MKAFKKYTDKFRIYTIKKLTTRQFYLVYTLSFLIASLILYSVFWFTGKTYIKYADGLDQYFYTFYYLGDGVRESISGIFAGSGVQIPLWDMSIGYGADILTTLHYYGLGDEAPFRYEVKRPVRSYIDENQAMLLGIYGTQFYFSLTDSNVADYFQEVYMSNLADFIYNDLDSRVILGTLAGVKYWMAEPGGGEEVYLPYGYEKIQTDGGTDIYHNQNYLPIGYTYDSYIPQSKWEKYSVTEKQYAMLQGCVVENSDLAECEPEQNGEEIGFSLSGEIETAEENYHINATEGNYELVIRLEDEIEENAELYVILEGMQFDGSRSSADLTIQCGKTRQNFNYRTERNNGYSGRHDFLFNMGSREAGSDRVVITLEHPGVYTFRNITIVQQPLQEIGKYVAERREAVLENITLGTNTLTGTIQTKEDKLLLLAIPYNQGWTARVDGKAAELKKANGMFMALEIGPGEHMIELRYQTRGLMAGIILSLVSICVFVAIFVYEWRRENISSLPSN